MKLVRDKIPQIICKNGEVAKTHIANEKEYERELLNKLDEELEELKKDKTVEEIADLIEVALALGKVYGKSEKEINILRKKKAKERGLFKKRIILE